MRRDYPLDTLRGLAILGMVLALLTPQTGLPRWMLPSNGPGMNWADLVFPFLVFAMGAAIPASLERRIPQTQAQDIAEANRNLFAWISTIGHVVWRGILLLGLAAFVRALPQPGFDPWISLIFAGTAMVVFAKFTSGPARLIAHIAALAAAGFLVLTYGFRGLDPYLVTLGINFIAAGLIWMTVRKTPSGLLAFAVIFGVVLLVKDSSPWLRNLWAWEALNGVPPFALLKFQLIALAGAAVGQGIVEQPHLGSRFERLVISIFGLLGAATVYIAIPSSSFSQALFGVAILGANALWFSAGINRSRISAAWGFGMLAVGLLFTGEAAVVPNPASLSYLLISGGIAALAYGFIAGLLPWFSRHVETPVSSEAMKSLQLTPEELEAEVRPRAGFLALVGQSPLFAFLLLAFVVPAVMSFTGQPTGWNGVLFAGGTALLIGIAASIVSKFRLKVSA